MSKHPSRQSQRPNSGLPDEVVDLGETVGGEPETAGRQRPFYYEESHLCLSGSSRGATRMFFPQWREKPAVTRFQPRRQGDGKPRREVDGVTCYRCGEQSHKSNTCKKQGSGTSRQDNVRFACCQ